MNMWTASLTLNAPSHLPTITTQQKQQLLNALAGRCAVLAIDKDRLRLTFDLPAPDFETATSAAKMATDDALLSAGLPPLEVTAAELLTSEEKRRVQAVTPDLMGVAEVAQFLGVSKQRVTQLAKTKDFPAPARELSATRIWLGPEIERFGRGWALKRRYT